MKRAILLLALLLIAATSIDQLNADFNAGTLTNVNVTNNSVILNGTPGNYTASGTFLSSIKDLGSNPAATISWTALSGSGTSLLVTSRSGNTSTPDSSWSAWAGPYASAAGSFVTAPTGRYHQYRLQLATTNTSNTPTVQSVMLTYSELGPSIARSSTTSNLTEQSSGTYYYYATAQDTVPISVEARYKIGSDNYTAYSAMPKSGSTYYIGIPEPSGNWSARKGETLYVNVYANDSENLSTNTTLTELIDKINQPPVLQPISNTTATERVEKKIFISGYDPDGDNITFGTDHGVIQNLSATSAYIVWTPNGTQTGLVNVTASVNDGYTTVSQTFVVNVTSVNDPPVMAAVTSQSGYYGDQIVFDITVHDLDPNQTHIYTVDPPLFAVKAYTPANASQYTYYARANFTALDNQKGFHNLTFTVSDGYATSSQNATLNISYCGDGVCQTNENATACAVDCAAAVAAPQYIAIQVPDRLCVNKTFDVETFSASSRYTCHYQGKAFNGAAYCAPLGGVGLTVYALDNGMRTQSATLTTSTNGTGGFTPQSIGEYKIDAEKTNYIGSSIIVTVGDCLGNISTGQEVVHFPTPHVTTLQQGPSAQNSTPQTQHPALTQQQTSLLSIIIWYVLLPLLLAALVYTGNAYYEINKDTDARILRARLALTELYIRMTPTVVRAWETIKPIVAPPARFVWNFALEPFWHLILRPVWKVIKPYAEQVGEILRWIFRRI